MRFMFRKRQLLASEEKATKKIPGTDLKYVDRSVEPVTKAALIYTAPLRQTVHTTTHTVHTTTHTVQTDTHGTHRDTHSTHRDTHSTHHNTHSTDCDTHGTHRDTSCDAL